MWVIQFITYTHCLSIADWNRDLMIATDPNIKISERLRLPNSKVFIANMFTYLVVALGLKFKQCSICSHGDAKIVQNIKKQWIDVMFFMIHYEALRQRSGNACEINQWYISSNQHIHSSFLRYMHLKILSSTSCRTSGTVVAIWFISLKHFHLIMHASWDLMITQTERNHFIVSFFISLFLFFIEHEGIFWVCFCFIFLFIFFLYVLHLDPLVAVRG